ncbi:MAG TPA: bifunctional diaminohydroxyphosphoribosylaminopyrimidine deaminase/5-amino-6-(5-phosphoribosylamino)uracil reductase RibD [Candidatus Limnocylindria bacterium]|jgi:diaminohydroxyphosphoribosylaminopyrimidine deaminase/5-amino-6-(5-phosphoribosylamino)uracil reductase|nr:bifunctional diaminohydroxyphosphoribosylaminopyrimidine deaminase/5-amino-6-(5-phosphoribosylamino)uracil reductase RibD [Candidatus Limnocylindria bacterium]
MTSDDERFMRRALELAEQGRGLTSPNPMVGAVVVTRGGEIVGEGAHQRAGAPHAEVMALRAAGPRTRGATLYVSLEPCAHHGRTPPCATAVLESGVSRVVAPLADPNPLVAGRGFEVLRRAGIEVSVGLLAEEAARQNRVFLTAMRERRPHVTLKAAMTLDGKIADTHGASRWITGERARARAHRLRSEADAIVVGVATVLRDDPELTVRLGEPWPREPYRVALDTEGRTPPGARFVSAGDPGRSIVAVGDGAPEERVGPLRAAGATVVRCPTRDGRVDLGFLLGELFAREVRGVLVEGGGEVHAAFLDAGVVDRVAVFVAPLLVGGRTAPSVVGGAGRELKGAVRLGPLSITPVGDDILVEADVIREPRGA